MQQKISVFVHYLIGRMRNKDAFIVLFISGFYG